MAEDVPVLALERTVLLGHQPAGGEPFGTPMTRSTLGSMLEAYSEKLLVCRSASDLKTLVLRLA